MHLLLVAPLLSIGFIVGAPPAVSAALGEPSCWNPRVTTRPDTPRELRVSCQGVRSARIVEQPAHGRVTDVAAVSYGFGFTLTADAEAPRADHALFELRGSERTVKLRVEIEVIPLSENSPPVCSGDQISQRSDGTERIIVHPHPHCSDPDLDDFVIRGGGPGMHPESPKHVRAGENESNWSYRTAGTSGTEKATIWATDSLGARSAEAELVVTFGTEVDSPPTCQPNPWFAWEGVANPVLMRLGTPRRFALGCTDADSDPFGVRITSLPAFGEITSLAIGPPYVAYDGLHRWLEGTYAPEAQSFESDEFSVTASGKDGDGPVNLITFIPRPPTENRGGGCSWSPANFQTGSSGEIAMWCSDSEGDALSAEVIEGPLHGTAGAPVVRPIPYAEFEILIPYTPDAGYEGDDFVKVAVDDGLGSRNEILVEINVTPSPPRPREPRPEVTPLPIPRPEDLAPQGTTGGRALARQVLGTRSVRRVRTPAAEVWAARKLSRQRLLRSRRAPGLLVLCKRRCRLRSESRLVTSRPVGGSGRPYRSAMTAQRRSGRLIWVVTSGADRRALRRGVAPRAAFKLGLRPAGRTRSRLRHTIRVGR